ncbi:hypothetical protein EZS27_043395, partial [termite gut metagenome]
KDNTTYIYNQEADLLGFGAKNQGGHCAAANYTNPSSEWTTLELICYEGRSLHLVNGKVAMALENSSYWTGAESLPLVEGKIQLQCESAEVFYKDIQIKEISELPATADILFNNKNQKMTELKIIATVVVKSSFQNEMEKVFRTVVDETRKEAGNISYELHQDIQNPLKYTILEVWKSQDAIDKHNE